MSARDRLSMARGRVLSVVDEIDALLGAMDESIEVPTYPTLDGGEAPVGDFLRDWRGRLAWANGVMHDLATSGAVRDA